MSSQLSDAYDYNSPFCDISKQDSRLWRETDTVAMARVLRCSIYLSESINRELCTPLKVTWESSTNTVGLSDCPSPRNASDEFLSEAITATLHKADLQVANVCIQGKECKIRVTQRDDYANNSFARLVANDYAMEILKAGRIPIAFSLRYDLRKIRDNPLYKPQIGAAESTLIRFIWNSLLADAAVKHLRGTHLVLMQSGKAGASSDSEKVVLDTLLIKLAYADALIDIASRINLRSASTRANVPFQRVFGTIETRSTEHIQWEEVTQSRLRKYVAFVASILAHELWHVDAERNRRVYTATDEQLADQFSQRLTQRVFGEFSLRFHAMLTSKAVHEGSWSVLNYKVEELDSALALAAQRKFD